MARSGPSRRGVVGVAVAVAVAATAGALAASVPAARAQPVAPDDAGAPAPGDPAPPPHAPVEPAPPPAPPPAETPPPPPREPTPFDQGRISLGASLGTQRSFDETYFVVGGRFGYYVLPGLELAAGGLKLWGDGPSIAMLSPEARYVLYPVSWPVRPFIGGFYRHWFIGGAYDDYDTIGGTVGALYFQRGSAFVLGLGVTVERVVSSCDETVDDCTLVYPAVVLGLSL